MKLQDIMRCEINLFGCTKRIMHKEFIGINKGSIMKFYFKNMKLYYYNDVDQHMKFYYYSLVNDVLCFPSSFLEDHHHLFKKGCP